MGQITRMAEADDASNGEAAAQRDLRLRRREILLAELAEARALRKRVSPRRTRMARERAMLHASMMRR